MRFACDCGARVFELFTCRQCGTAYARAYTDDIENPSFLWQEPGHAFNAASGPVTELQAIDLLLEELPALVSILHRISGAALFLVGIPVCLIALQASLASPDALAEARSLIAHPLAKLVLLGLLWSYLHHLCAGVRFLLLDLHQGIELGPARQSSIAVLAASLALTIAIGVRLW